MTVLLYQFGMLRRAPVPMSWSLLLDGVRSVKIDLTFSGKDDRKNGKNAAQLPDLASQDDQSKSFVDSIVAYTEASLIFHGFVLIVFGLQLRLKITASDVSSSGACTGTRAFFAVVFHLRSEIHFCGQVNF